MEISQLKTNKTGNAAWEMTAWVAGIFSLTVALIMVAGHFTHDAVGFLKAPELKELKEKLRLNPMDEKLKETIRQADLAQRGQYFRQLEHTRWGGYLLIGGVAVFIYTFNRREGSGRVVSVPKTKLDFTAQSTSRAVVGRWSVACGGLGITTLILALSLHPGTALPRNPAEVEKLVGDKEAAPAGNDFAPLEDIQRNWPRFRGPGGNGVTSFTNQPNTWDAKSGTNIAWKIPMPSKGFSSPISWGDRVYFSGGDAKLREVICLDAKSGQILWRQAVVNVPGSPTQALEIPDSTGYAAATMATDGKRVYVFFANGDLAALTLGGKPVWSKAFGALKNPYGPATSLTTWEGTLIVQLDQGESEEGKSKLYGIDGQTGKVLWQQPRKVGASWATPIVIQAAGKAQVITLAVPWVIAYSATNGAELWRVEGLNGEITPSPVFAGGLVVVASPSEKLLGIRPDGQGDVSKTHVAWTNEDNVPDITSPVSNGELVFTVSTSGMLTCFDAKDGKKLWEHDYELECHASPSLAGNKLYLIGQKGAAVVVEAGRQFKELLRTDIGDAFHASPAFLQDRIILRGVTNVWCIAAGPPAGTNPKP